MRQMRTELSRLTKQTAADESAMETLTALLRQAMQLHQVPVTCRTLESPDIRILYDVDCGKLRLRRQPYRGVYREDSHIHRLPSSCFRSADIPHQPIATE